MSNVSSIGPSSERIRERNFFLFLSDEGPKLETLDYTIRIGSTPTILYFDLYRGQWSSALWGLGLVPNLISDTKSLTAADKKQS